MSQSLGSAIRSNSLASRRPRRLLGIVDYLHSLIHPFVSTHLRRRSPVSQGPSESDTVRRSAETPLRQRYQSPIVPKSSAVGRERALATKNHSRAFAATSNSDYGQQERTACQLLPASPALRCHAPVTINPSRYRRAGIRRVPAGTRQLPSRAKPLLPFAAA